MFPSDTFYPAPRASPYSALTRAKIAFFVDTWLTKVNTLMYPVMNAEGKEKEQKGEELVAAVKKEIEPLLKDAGPFFGGSQELTLAEALTAPFVVRYKTFSGAGLMPVKVSTELDQLPHYSRWSKAIAAKESVMYIYDEPMIMKGIHARLEKMKAGGK